MFTEQRDFNKKSNKMPYEGVQNPVLLNFRDTNSSNNNQQARYSQETYKNVFRIIHFNVTKTDTLKSAFNSLF